MSKRNDAGRKPAITLHSTDYERLYRIAETFSARSPEIAEELMAELDRARIVSKPDQAQGYAAMGSTVSYETDDGEDRTVTLVYPADADIELGKISIMTPIGVALIGLAKGHSMNWVSRDGKTNVLTVQNVSSPPSEATDAA